MRSLGDVAMVPYQEWNFLAQVDTDWTSAYIQLETIRYISSQTIRKPGVPDYMDDSGKDELPVLYRDVVQESFFGVPPRFARGRAVSGVRAPSASLTPGGASAAQEESN